MGKHSTLRRRAKRSTNSAVKRKKILTPSRRAGFRRRAETPGNNGAAAAKKAIANAASIVADAAKPGVSETTPLSPEQKQHAASRLTGAVRWFRRWVLCKRPTEEEESVAGSSLATSPMASSADAASGLASDSLSPAQSITSSSSSLSSSTAMATTTTQSVPRTMADASTGTEDAHDVFAYLVLKKLDFLAETNSEMRSLYGVLQANMNHLSDRVEGMSSEVRSLRGQYTEGLATVRRETQDAVQGSVGELEDCIQREVLKATSRSRTMMRREQQVQNASARKSRSSSSSHFGSADTSPPPAAAAAAGHPEDDAHSMLANIFDSIKELKAALQQVQRGGGAASVVRSAASAGGSAPVSLAAALGTSPSLQKYARMLSMGIPEQAVRNKMKMDGVEVPAATRTAKSAPGPSVAPALPGMAPPPPPSFAPPPKAAGSSAPKGFAPRVHANPAFSKYSKMLKMGIPEVAVKQKMTMDGLDWKTALGMNSGATGAAGGRQVITADALKGIKLKNSKKRKLAKKKKPDPKKAAVSGGQLQISEDMLKSVKLKNSRKPRKQSSKAAQKLKGAATAVGLCVGPGGFGMTLDALKSVKLRKSKKKVVSPSKRKKPDRASPKVLFQLKKTSRSVPRSPGGTPLLSKKKRRMSILGQTVNGTNPEATQSPIRM